MIRVLTKNMTKLAENMMIRFRIRLKLINYE